MRLRVINCRKSAQEARVREIPLADIHGDPITANPMPHTLGPEVERALARLSEADQEILRQWTAERMAPSAIAAEAGLKGGRASAWYRIKGALARLQVALAEEGVTEETFEAPPPTCSVKDCERPPKTRGLCWKHYENRRKNGKR